jgi:ABC-type antimicrobial peptide transport system permease subunit
MSFSVSQRTQELGVRMALGADSRRILRMVLRQGSLVTAIGLGIGLLLTLGVVMIAGTGIQSVLFGVSARDPLIYVTVVALVGIVSLAATVVPARRATRVDPMIALRAE